MADRVIAHVHEKPVACPVCGSEVFYYRSIMLNTRGLELLDMSWANQQSIGLICESCGHLDEFVGDVVKLYEAQDQ